MRSSTSSFERRVPSGNWERSFVIAAVLAAAFLGGWEATWRSRGYSPTLNDTSDLWAANRTRVGSDPGQTVIIGSSRILFDLDLGAYAEAFGTRPVQLALPGSTPAPVLYHLAEKTAFRGTLLVGVTPPLFFVPAGFPVERSETAIRRYENWSPSQRCGNFLGKLLQKRVAFLNEEDLALNVLLGSLPVADREGARENLPPVFPPYFGRVEEDRQVWMWEKCDFGSPLALRIQNIWKPLFTPPPPPPGVTPEQAKEQYLAAMEATLERTRRSVETIRERGGRVVFIRPPSSGWVRETENAISPRPGFWDRILAATGAPGVHFEDYPELSGFTCPEWSHLTAEDAARFTRALLPILQDIREKEGSRQSG
jgi:hypothetical protein